jgi:hypothetical protein
LILLLAALSAFAIVPAAQASAAQMSPPADSNAVSLQVAATAKDMPRSTGPVRALLVAGYCDNNTTMRLQADETSTVTGTCQRIHSIYVACYRINASSGIAYGLIDNRSLRKFGFGNGNHVYVQALPPQCA